MAAIIAYQSLTNWKDVDKMLLAFFFLPSKNTETKTIIATFVQGFDEPLCEVWEIVKDLLRKFLNHGFKMKMQVQIICNPTSKQDDLLVMIF